MLGFRESVLRCEALALPDDNVGIQADRVMEPPPGAARVRFIADHTGYQTGSVIVRTGGDAGGIDLDLPAVCSRAFARAAAKRALVSARDDRVTATPGPLESLSLEPGDTVMIEDDARTWRVARLDMDERPTIMLEPIATVRPEDDGETPAAGEPARLTGAPFFRMLDLPPLAGAEGDGRPLAAVAASPWRPMRVFAGADVTSLTRRGDASEPATVGVLVEALPPGGRNRWDEVSILDLRVEGRPPESLSVPAVLAGGNAIAIETVAGWEIVQFREAALLAGDVWRLTGLLRGQQGTEEATRAGASTGAIAVFLTGLERVESPPAERGLELIWRAGPAGAPPGGAGVTETAFAPTGFHLRPWSPAHLRRRMRSDGGVDLTWLARLRIDGDRWDGEAANPDPMRFRVRVFDAEAVVRQFEVDTADATYSSVEAAGDFPDGLSAAEVAVAQWAAGYGWGVEARISLA